MPIVSTSFLASAGERTGVAPLVTTCFGPRTGAAGFTGRTWADDEPVAERADRGQVLLHSRGRPPGGSGCGPRTWSGSTDSSRRPRPSHHPRTALPPARTPPRVRSFAIRPAKNSTNFPTATGPALTISRGNASATASTAGVSTTGTILRPVEPHLDPPALDRHPSGQVRQLRAHALGRHLEPDPGQPGLLKLGGQALAAFLLMAERGPPPVLLELLQELCPRECLLVADEFGPEGRHEGGDAHLADAPKSRSIVAPGEEPAATP